MQFKFLRILHITTILMFAIFCQAEPFSTYPLLAQSLSSPLSKSNGETRASTKSKKRRPRDTGQVATIKIDGSAVYEVANFDSPILEYLDRGKKVKISKKIYPGIGGLGAFYKIRIAKGVYGFIADTDVQLKSGSRERPTSSSRDEQEPVADPLQIQNELMSDADPETPLDDTLYLNKYIGLAFYNYNYVEVIRNISEEAGTTVFGLKHSGPTKSFGGLPLDINVLLTTGAPDFYSEIASSTSGFMILGDALVTFPLYESKQLIVYYGLGLVFRYSSWDVTLTEQPSAPPVSSVEVALGASGGIGAGVALTPKIILRSDFRYNYEKEKYFGFGAALQFKY